MDKLWEIAQFSSNVLGAHVHLVPKIAGFSGRFAKRELRLDSFHCFVDL